MRKVLIILVLLLLTSGVSFALASMALAECRPNQVEVTIYNEHSGRIMVICVNEAAVEHLGGEGDIVIPATCPCFSHEDVEMAIANDPEACGYMYPLFITAGGEPCGAAFVTSQVTVPGKVFGVYKTAGKTCYPPQVYELSSGGYCTEFLMCKWSDYQTPFCTGPNVEGCVAITDDELQACMAIMDSLEWVPHIP